MNNQLILLALPKPNEDKAEIARLRAIIEQQQELLALWIQRNKELRQSLDALNYPTASLWQEASRDMVI